MKPDIEDPAVQALQTAHLIALKKALQKGKEAERKEQLKVAIQAAQREVDRLKEQK